MKVFWLVFLLHLVNKTAYGIPISAAESSAAREDDVLAQQDVKRNEGEERYKRNSYLAPFDTKEQGRCPYTDDEWKQFRISWNCSSAREGSTYHCTHYNDYEDPREACGIPQFCDKGKGPVIVFPEGHSKVAKIDCDWCPEDYFNPLESIRSDQYSSCPEIRHKCTDRGLVECDIVKGVERYWTDSKCECDINNNFFPPYKEKNKCSDHSGPCFEEWACEKSPEGFDQIYNFSASEGYVCQPGCKEGFEFKTPQSKKCEPVQRNDGNITTFENETTIYNSSLTMLVRTTTTGSYTTTTKPNTTAKIVRDATKTGNNVGADVVCGIIFGILGILAVTVYLCIGCYKYFTSGATDDGRGRYIRVNEKRVSAPLYILCWPRYITVDLPPDDENVELQVDLPPADENVDQRVDIPPADENVELKVDLPPAVVPPVAAPANGNVVPQVAASANGNVVPQVAEPANGNVVPQVAAPANGNVVPQVAAPANGNVVPQVAAPANGNVVPQGDLPRADENGPQVDGHSLTTGSDEPKESLPHIEDNPAILNETVLDVNNPLHLEENLVDNNQTLLKVPTSEENQPQRRNMEQQEYSGGNSSSSSETESQDLPQPAADGRSSNQRVLEPQGKQRWINALPEKLKQMNASYFYRLHEFIGKGWKEFAKLTGLSNVDIQHIEMDSENKYDSIQNVLQKWYQSNEGGEVTLLDVLHILKKCPFNTDINWNGLKLYISSESVRSR